MEWTIREQLILASAVQRSGDQNWVSVSRAIKPLVDTDGRPADYFSQKNCAQQYSAMLDKAGTHKRKRSTEGTSEVVETAGQQIVRELTEKYMNHLNQELSKTKEEYMSLKKEINQLEKGELDSKLPAMWEEMQRELAASKEGSGLKIKSSSSTPNSSKHHDQVKQRKKKSPSSQASQSKEAMAESSAVTGAAKGIASGEATTKKRVKVEPNSVENPKVVISEVASAPSVTSASSGIDPSAKVPMTVTIKKEPISSTSTPSPMDVESPLPLAVLSTIASPQVPSPQVTSPQLSSPPLPSPLQLPSPKEEKFGVPMHTPQPSTHHGGQMSGEVHLIVQQPNVAALVAEEKTKKTFTASTALAPERITIQRNKDVGILKSIPIPATAVVLSSSTMALTSTVQSMRTSSTAVIGDFKQPIVVPKEPLKPLGLPVNNPLSSPSLLVGRPHVVLGVEARQTKQVAVKFEGRVSSSKPHLMSTSKLTTYSSPVTAQTNAALPAPATRKPSIPTATPPAIPATAPPPPPPTTPTTTILIEPRVPPTLHATHVSTLPAQDVPVRSSASVTSVSLVNKPPPQQKSTSNPHQVSLREHLKQHGEHLIHVSSKPVLSEKLTKPLSPPIPRLAAAGVKCNMKPTVTATTEQRALAHVNQTTAITGPIAATRVTAMPTTTRQTAPTDPRIRASPALVFPPPVPVLPAAPPPPAPVPPAPMRTTAMKLPHRPKPEPAAVEMARPKPKLVEKETPTSSPALSSQQLPMPKGKEEGKMSVEGVGVKKATTPSDIKKDNGIIDVGSGTKSAIEPASHHLVQSVSPVERKWVQPPFPLAPVMATPTCTVMTTPTCTVLATPISTSTDSKLTTPSSLGEQEAPPVGMASWTSSPVTGKGVQPEASVGMEKEEGEPEDMDEETPFKPPIKISRSSLKKQWNTRSRKRKAPFDDGYSVDSTDTEDDVTSSHASAISSPAPSQSNEMDVESVQAHKQWKKAIIIVWRHAAQHKYANLFLHPVREEDALGYKNVVLRPMDLSTIKKKIESGLVKTDIEFQRDMLLMFQNAFMYNNAEHEVYYMAQEMKSDVMENIQAYLATQAQLQLMEETTPSKTLRSRESRLKDIHEELFFSPAKKRRTRADD